MSSGLSKAFFFALALVSGSAMAASGAAVTAPDLSSAHLAAVPASSVVSAPSENLVGNNGDDDTKCGFCL